jgi:hypothetical protein
VGLPAALLVRETALQFASPMPMRSTPARAPKLPATRMYATARALLMRDSASSAGDLITLMQMPNDVTLTAMRHVQGNIQSGMQAADVSKLMGDATVNLGGSHEFSLVLLNEASAFPHGSKLAQTAKARSFCSTAAAPFKATSRTSPGPGYSASQHLASGKSGTW